MRNRLQNTSHRWVSHLANSSNKTLPPPLPGQENSKSNETKLNETEDWRPKTEDWKPKWNFGSRGRVVVVVPEIFEMTPAMRPSRQSTAQLTKMDVRSLAQSLPLSLTVARLSVFGCLFWMVFRFGLFAARSLTHLVTWSFANCSTTAQLQSQRSRTSIYSPCRCRYAELGSARFGTGCAGSLCGLRRVRALFAWESPLSQFPSSPCPPSPPACLYLLRFSKIYEVTPSAHFLTLNTPW